MIVGQDDELATIDAVLDAAAGAVCFVGTPGMGRSALAREAERRAVQRGFRSVSPTHASSASDATTTVIDDVQRLGPAEVDALSALVRARVRPVIMTMDRGSARESSPLSELWRDGMLERRDLKPMGRDNIAELVRQILGTSLDTPSLQRIVEYSGGNPRLVHELVRAARDTDALVTSGAISAWVGPLQATPRLRDVVVADIDLDGTVMTLVEFMAVSGGLDLGTAITVTSIEVAEDAETRGVARVAVDGRRRRLEFAHPIVAEVIRDRMGQIRLARRATTLIETTRGHRRAADEVERTLWCVLAGHSVDVTAITAAAESSRLAGGPAAAEWLARAAAATGDDAAIVELSECLYWQGRFREQIDLLDRHPLADAPAELRARRGRQLTAAWFWGLGRREVAMALFDRILTELGDDEAALSLLGHRAEARMFVGAFEEAIEDAEAVLASPESNVVGRLSAFTGLVPALVLSGRVEDALERAPEGIAVMLANPRTDFAGAGSFVGLCLGWFFTGKFQEVDDLVGGLYAESLVKSDDPLRGTWAVLLGRTAYGRGDLKTAVSMLTEASLGLDQHDPGRMRVWCMSLLSEAHAQMGNADQAAIALEEAEAVTAATIRCYDVELQLAHAWCAAATGARERSRAIALNAADAACESRAWGVAALALNEAWRLGAPTKTRWTRVGPNVQGPLFAAMEGAARSGDDPTRGIAAAERFDALGTHLWAAEMYARAARGHARRGDFTRMAAAQASCLGQMARCPGASTPGLIEVDDLSRTGELSEREREIAQLAARGSTNREIAAELLLSVRTVENHLAHALRKLGISSRRNLIGFFGP